MFLRDVSAMLKRFLALCLALAFLVGATAQVMPCSMARSDMPAGVGKMAGCADQHDRCGNHVPNCLDHVGCAAVTALPGAPISIAVAFAWAPLVYDPATASISGISVKPELSPPILLA
jgi:hypothetical protein